MGSEMCIRDRAYESSATRSLTFTSTEAPARRWNGRATQARRECCPGPPPVPHVPYTSHMRHCTDCCGAERLRRAEVLESEGYRQRLINQSEGDRQSAINSAQGEAESIRLRAVAEAESVKLLAQAEAERTRMHAAATADGLRQVAEALNTEGGRRRWCSVSRSGTWASLLKWRRTRRW